MKFALFLFACAIALSAATTPPQDGKNCWMRKSGNFKDAIWARENTLPPQKKLRPDAHDSAALGLRNGVLEITSPVTLFSYSSRAPDATTRIANGADFVIDWFFGQRGMGSSKREGSNGVFDMTGGVFTVKSRFILAGQISEDCGKGLFLQKAGTVNVGGTGIYLTGNLPLTSSQLAVGVYELRGGTLNIACTTPNEAGLIKGVGKGEFRFVGGTLNASHVGISLDNLGTGNLSPAGDEAVGLTRLVSKTPARYVQGSNARMTVNVASRNACDQLLWLGTSAKNGGSVVLEPDTLFKIVPIKNYRPRSGDSYAVIVADSIEMKGEPNVRCEGTTRPFEAKISGKNPQKLLLICQ